MRLAGRSPRSVISDRLDRLLTYESFDLDTADWDRLLDGVDVVHHYAWSTIPETANNDPVGDLQTNVLSTLMLLEAMRRRGGGKLIFGSSGRHCLWPSQGGSGDRGTCAGADLALRRGEGRRGAVPGRLSVRPRDRCRIARLSNPFGIGQSVERNQGAATVFMHRALAGEPIRIYGDGEIVRDYIHISDVVTGYLR